MITLFFFLFGLAMGSFIGATVWRFREGKKAIAKKSVDSSRSICDNCHHKLTALDLVPVFSWLFLRGKCRYCDKKIHWQHPLTELISGALFALSWAFWPYELAGLEAWLMFGLWLIFLSYLIAITIYDIKFLEIDNKMVYPIIALAIVWRFVDAIFFDGGAEAMRELALGILVGGGLFFILFYVSNERWMGGGDVKLGFFYGAWLGPAKALTATIVGFYSAFLIIVPLLVTKRISRKQPVPFGPFLIFGVFVATLWGADLIEWYKDYFLLD